MVLILTENEQSFFGTLECFRMMHACDFVAIQEGNLWRVLKNRWGTVGPSQTWDCVLAAINNSSKRLPVRNEDER